MRQTSCPKITSALICSLGGSRVAMSVRFTMRVQIIPFEPRA